MVGASKILTVSYGTFSCTLEGFDEPFTTMKAIAEYFRDLAAEDRYFGAEPPQPDAEMLHRIAEREMARRVDAKIEKNSVILRPGDSVAPDRATEPGPAPLAVQAVTPVAPVVIAAVAPAVAPPAEPVGDPISESVAAKLQRIRSAVAQARATQTVAEPESAPEPGPADSAPAERTAESATAELPEEIAAIAPPEDFGFALDISGPLSADEAQEIVTDQADEDEDESPDPTAGMDPEKAERMRRRAERRAARLVQAEAEAQPAVAESPETPPEVEAAPVAPEAEASPAEPAAETPRPVIRARVIKLRRAEPIAPPAPTATPTAEEEAPAEDIDRMLAPVSATVAETVAPPAAAESAAVLSPEAEAELMAELAALTENLGDGDWGIEAWDAESPTVAPDTAVTAPAAKTEAEVEAAAAAAGVPEVAAEEIDIEAFVVQLEPETEPETTVEPVETLAAAAEPPPLDVDAIFAETAPETPPPETPPVATPPVAAVLPEALPPGFVDRRAPTADPFVLPPRPAAKVSLPEGDLPRLLEKADAQMAGNENRRRISAIAHLKAAVAATVAERRTGTEETEKDETAPYRQDLTQVVRPRRPVMPAVGDSHHQTAARPEVRPAPLVLVSEQRVDRAPAEAVAKAQAVRPRRIIATSLAQEAAPDDKAEDEIEVPLSPEEASSFAEFAQSRSPQGLAELLEAAAAYTAQVEGRPHFSPPHILSKVSAVGDASFSREDRLRVFGTLLRQGKIAKVKRGQYAITEASRFYQARA